MRSISHCPVCNHAEIQIKRVVDNFPIWECKNCGLYWVPDVPDEILNDFYGSQYFQGSHEFGYGDYLASEKVIRLNAQDLLHVIAEHVSEKNLSKLRLLDVGCAYGFLVDEACQMGFDAEGIDSSSLAGEYARSVLKRRVQTGMIGSAHFEPEQFDIVTSTGSIEHLNDAVRFVDDVARVTKPGGLLVVTTLDTKRFLGIFRFKPPEHLFYFSHSNIALLLETKGFVVERLTGYTARHVFGEALGLLCKALFGRWLDTDRLIRNFPFRNMIIKVPNNEMLVIARKR